MLRPGAGVWRSSRYAANLAAWYAHLPKSQLKVIATEELEAHPDELLSEIIDYLGLAGYPRLPSSSTDHFCMTSKRADTRVEPTDSASSAAWRAGRLDDASDEGSLEHASIDPCIRDTDKAAGSGGSAAGSGGSAGYAVEKATASFLRSFFAPYNQRLFKLIGRTLPWDGV